MVNAFLKYGISIAFLIVFLNINTANSCDYNTTNLKVSYTYIKHNIEEVRESLQTNFTGVCRADSDIIEMFPDTCDNTTRENMTKKLYKENCYNHAQNVSSCCQVKNLVYIGCLMHQQMKALKPVSPKIIVLKDKLRGLVSLSNDKLCGHIPNKKTRSRTRVRTNSTEVQHVCRTSEIIEGFVHHWQKFQGSVD